MPCRRRRFVVLGSVGCVLAIGANVPAARGAALPSETVTCGQSVDHSLRLANDLQLCPANGLVVAADGITIDLGGHRLGGLGAGTGVGIDNIGHVRVTVRNGVVTEFGTGVRYASGAAGLVTGITAFSNTIGINVGNSAGTTVKKNLLTANTGYGIRVDGTSPSVFVDNVAVGNNIGILLDNAKGASVTKNRLSANFQDGIDIEGSENVVQKNVVSGNGDFGVVLQSDARSNVLKRNVVVGNRANGIYVNGATDNTIEGNVASGNGWDGIAVGANDGNVVSKNVANENGQHGISSETAALTLEGNRADRNGFLGGGPGDDVGAGIAVVPGTTNAKNKASGNDDPRECLPPELSCAVPTT